MNNPREGWDEAFKEMHENGDDELLIPDVFEDEVFEPDVLPKQKLIDPHANRGENKFKAIIEVNESDVRYLFDLFADVLVSNRDLWIELNGKPYCLKKDEIDKAYETLEDLYKQIKKAQQQMLWAYWKKYPPPI